MQSKNDWKKNDTILNKHKINTKTNWVNRELNFNQTFHSSVNHILDKNNLVDEKTDEVKLQLAMKDLQLAEEHQRRKTQWKTEKANTVVDRTNLNSTWQKDDSKLRDTIKDKENKIFTYF